MTSGWETTVALLLSLAAFPVALLLTRFFMSFNMSRGIWGIDVHKLSKPKIAEMCGTSIPITLVGLSLINGALHADQFLVMVAFAAVVGSAGIVGAIDDKIRMRGRYKPLLGLLYGLPIVILGILYPHQIYNSTLRVPIFGSFNLPIIYPLTILVAVSVTSNTTNMLDPLNGTMSGGVAILCTGLLVGLLFKGAGPTPIFLYGALLFSSLGLFYFNRYPSRAFAGNVGQLAVGGALGAMAILGRAEIATIVAMFPNIQNSFFFLSRIRRFAEHREISAKPTKLLPDGKLASSENPQAPLTLVRTMLVGQPTTEKDVVSSIFALYAISSILAFITIMLTG
jgi:UDP-N-acetylmuramyl pentapeptide phosphotransferase/UDP-N-acetylglucosamine-1-phosphate transferase